MMTRSSGAPSYRGGVLRDAEVARRVATAVPRRPERVA
jgi:hypothetical protein